MSLAYFALCLLTLIAYSLLDTSKTGSMLWPMLVFVLILAGAFRLVKELKDV